MRVPFKTAVLSLSQYFSPEEKDVLHGRHTKEGRLSLSDHVKKIIREGRINEEYSTVVISVRNVMANLRCGAWIRGLTEDFVCVAGENPYQSKRPYHALCCKDDRLEICELFPSRKTLENYDWVITGVPVLWEDQTFERMLTECADHSHVFNLPRGNHPEANEASKKRWSELHEVFKSVLHEEREVAFLAMQKASDGLRMEDEYFLHNVLAIDGQGRLLQISDMGSLGSLGLRLRSRGASRALMVDNGGSVVVRLYPNGLRNQGFNLLTLPNHRPLGTAYLFLQMDSAQYEYLWSRC